METQDNKTLAFIRKRYMYKSVEMHGGVYRIDIIDFTYGLLTIQATQFAYSSRDTWNRMSNVLRTYYGIGTICLKYIR